MIPNSRHIRALFKGPTVDGVEIIHSDPVVAFDDDGNALVADRATGKLVLANARPNFIRLDHHVEGPTVGMIPGAGWRVESFPTDAPSYIEPVIGWSIHSRGIVSAYAVNSDGEIYEVHDIDNHTPFRLLPPATSN